MSNYDNPGDEALKKAFDSRLIPDPDPAARRKSIALAREEFEATLKEDKQKNIQSTQGFLNRLRHIFGNQPDDGRASMFWNQRFIYSGVAAAAIGAVAIGVSLQYLPVYNNPGRDFPGVVRPGGQVSEALSPDSLFLEKKQKRLAESNALTGPAERERVLGADLDAVLADQAVMPAKTFATSPVAPAAKAQLNAGQGMVAQESDVIAPPHYEEAGRDDFKAFEQNRVNLVTEEPVSTFSVDVDTASYSFVRRMLNSGVLPQGDAVRAEEMINYFDYDYPLPEARSQPFRPTVAVSDSPWAEGRKLMHIGIKGYDVAPGEQPRSNLVFLLDVSGSMNSPDKLPLVKQSMELLLTTLQPEDTVAIAVYAGAAGTVLEPTPVREKQKILGALRQLSAGGSTAGAQGIRLAYELAAANFDESAVNRVVLATDGDFNVGITNQRELQSFIERKREEGVYLSVLGFGRGNYQDAMMQTLAQNGNGVAAYIDTLGEAQKVLVDEATSALFPIATDVKLQVEFNPATVAEYRLIGYETRHLKREDFNNDAVDAGDIGAGHSVTAIYEFTPVGSPARQIEDSRYTPDTAATSSAGNEYAFLKVRYKLPGETTSRLISRPVTTADAIEPGGKGISREAGFATAVAGFAQLLKGGKYTGDFNYDEVIALAQANRGDDPFGYRTEFIQLVRKAKTAAAMQSR
mgnify:FL=1